MAIGWQEPIAAAGMAVLIGTACGSGSPEAGEPASDAVTRQPAAMILHHPHDDHVFGELPPGLESVEGAIAELERRPDGVTGMIDTWIEPGHVGRLLAVVINNPAACTAPTPATACGPHEEEFNPDADGGFYLGSGAVADADGRVRLTVSVAAGQTSNVLCGGAANPIFDACARGFALRHPLQAEVTLVVLDNGPAAERPEQLARQLAAPAPCPDCPPFTVQIAIGFGRDAPSPEQRRSQ